MSSSEYYGWTLGLLFYGIIIHLAKRYKLKKSGKSHDETSESDTFSWSRLTDTPLRSYLIGVVVFVTLIWINNLGGQEVINSIVLGKKPTSSRQFPLPSCDSPLVIETANNVLKQGFGEELHVEHPVEQQFDSSEESRLCQGVVNSAEGAVNVSFKVERMDSDSTIFVVQFVEDPTAAEQAESTTRAEVEDFSRSIIDLAGQDGLIFEPIDTIQFFQLSGGEVRESFQRIERGGSVVVVGGCDQDCSVLDLIVFSPEGLEINRDQENDARPIIAFEPEVTGDYRIIATMFECETDWCSAGYQILKSQSLLPEPEPEVAAQSGGTGFIVDLSGGILTANHVVDGATSITVVLADGIRYAAAVERRSLANDIALLRIGAKTPSYLSIADSGSMMLGDRIFVTGYPMAGILGNELKYTEGTVTALSGMNEESSKFQMSVPIQPGSSGSPVIDRYGQVVGIATSSISDTNFYQETDAMPQLVNWATKASIAAALTGRQTTSWRTSDHRKAIKRAQLATVQIIAEN